MQTFATDLLEHSQQVHSIHRREVCLSEVNELRLAFSTTIRFLCETNDEYDADLASSLSVYRNRLLTEPLNFRVYSDEALVLLRTLHAPQLYGDRFYKGFNQLVANLETIANHANPLLDVIAQDIEEAVILNRSLKIWCYARSKILYQDLARQRLKYELDDGWFVHSVSMYGNQRPFDDLLLVGPMRARGWNRLPDAVVSAPRFHTVKQIVWDGLIDDPGLGYDPVLELKGGSEKQHSTAASAVVSVESGAAPFNGAFTSTVQRIGHNDATGVRFEVEDELVWTRQSVDAERSSRAFALSLSDDSCMLWAPRTKVLSYCPLDDESPVAMRSTMVDLAIGMYAIIEIESAHDGNVLPGSIYASRYTDVWRSKLEERVTVDPEDLVRKLRMRGLYLKTLNQRIHQWAGHDAPRQYKHFEILIQELGLANFDPEKNCVRPGFQFARKAFKVISSGRGMAISSGREVADRIERKRVIALNSVRNELRDLATGAHSFTYQIDAGDESDGLLEFDRITEIEHGFIVPYDMMRYKINRLEVDKWRL